ncbi:4-hydroxythreonine-4-phosphate dehydrogenase PdxA [Hydrogenobacter sp. T-2]|uniref:4-hydroxythreonine-4-phosphate dehydrogenase PdxA n=1 Tax=Pampinifervens diazotrophicum TaxID=1632018 RepID=UPI002B257D83|nr:4-hydroxythreonine-4-phosphate dehydrogenase PdxA [Hydrogenobacter sp. T-2]WPM31394.1 4-hydroxythreonine-4-phosphate dehydrogenase PdxA [Hydrogenobacter sp. T-2]
MVKIGITIGDPAGVGPELIVRLSRYFDPQKAYIIYGEKKIIQAVKRELSVDFEFSEIYTVEEIKSPGVYIADLNISETDRPLPSLTSGKVAVAYLGRAVVDAVYGKIHGLLTMPINKFWAKLAGFSYEGQTEFLAQACNVREYAMLMYSEKLRVVPFTTHIPLREVPERIRKDDILKKVKLIDREFKRLFGLEPVVGILGLNPHAGDMGAIGEEDMKEIAPAVEALKEEGYKVEGPLSPDSAFLNINYDVYLCMYHDQGLIPFKMLAFREGVNLTLGIPFVRTSPDHGVAYDIAWKDIADEGPSLSALRLCERLAEKVWE